MFNTIIKSYSLWSELPIHINTFMIYKGFVFLKDFEVRFVIKGAIRSYLNTFLPHFYFEMYLLVKFKVNWQNIPNYLSIEIIYKNKKNVVKIN